MQYGNFTKGIKNKSVFDVPDYCKPKALPRCAQAEWQAVTFVKNGEGSSASSGSFRMAIDFEHQMEAYDGYYSPDEGGSKQPFKVVKFFAQVSVIKSLQGMSITFCLTVQHCPTLHSIKVLQQKFYFKIN